MKSRAALVFVLFCLLVPVLGADGFQMVEQNLATIASKSDVIIRCTVEDSKVKTIYPESKPNGIVVTQYKALVSDWIKAPESVQAAGNNFEFDVWGTSRREAQKLGAPYFVGFYELPKGNEVVLFLTKTPLGIYNFMGMTQGVFEVKYASDGKAMVVNKYSNESLFKTMPQTGAAAKAMKSVNINPSAPPKDISYDDLKKMVDVLK
jgi:hypothetical protein